MSVYSYHTFILPFIWEGTQEKRRSMEEFVQSIASNPNWRSTDMTDEYRIGESPNLTANGDVILLYKEYQYFHPYVRKAIYGFDGSIVRNFSFMPDSVRNKAHYYITKKGTTYDLLVNAIRLKVYNTGVALFILECENHGFDADGGSQDNLDAVKNINDYGRRISLPFIPTGSPDFSVTADLQKIELDGVFSFVDDYRSFIERINAEKNASDGISLTHMCDFVKYLLGFGGMFGYSSRSDSADESTFYIYPAVDDRMFVACYVCDKKETNRFLEQDDAGEFRYITDDELSRSIYELIFVDPNDNCSCVSKSMRKNLIEKHIYDRWIGYGTVYAIANQSLIMLTNSDIDYLCESFLTQYVQMCCICLAQKSTLIHFQREAAGLSAHIEERGKAINKDTIKMLMNLQERFVAYQSQLYFSQLSPQEQAIEMYDMIQDSMLIEKETETLEKHITSLQSAADTNLDYTFNVIAVIFTVISTLLTILQCIQFYFSSTDSAVIRLGWIFAFVSAYLLVCILFYYKRKK